MGVLSYDLKIGHINGTGMVKACLALWDPFLLLLGGLASSLDSEQSETIVFNSLVIGSKLRDD